MTDMASESAVDMAQTEDEQKLPAKLEQLKAAATREYSLKNYGTAAERYADACEVQDLVNGEMSIENADLLYQYGRCLYHVAVANSDVLGGKVASSEEPTRKKRKVAKKEQDAGEGGSSSSSSSSNLIGDAIKSGEQKLAEDVVEAAVGTKDGIVSGSAREGTKETTKPGNSSNPFFQISGDDNWTDSEDDGEDADGEDGEAEDDDDDFAIAFEVLDMARILLARKLESLQDSKDKSEEEKPEARQIRERLADTHDLQAEIALENERFSDAINDTRDSLALKMQLYPEENSLIAEAHFKLSLALEFASVTSTQEDANGVNKVAQVDEEMRADAAKEMELAIASCRARIAKEEASLASLDEAKAAEVKKSLIDVKEMVGEMETRLEDLRKPAASLSAMQNLGPAGAPGAEEEAMRGILGSLLGESKGEQQKRIQEATAKANDLTGMVKKKKPKAEPVPQQQETIVEGKGKRKADDGAAGSSNGNGKKVKFAEEANGDDA
ncbi:putative tetratricopeptide-like helical domain superfamily, tetratricopeptide, SHNi-TPR [Septoria linicola]|nr:putative tetratricopeptide-like helical domain superfamily, tetratricopeptide, SHNi-TPR [Septoria linicola]